jgi:hypothetical protein
MQDYVVLLRLMETRIQPQVNSNVSNDSKPLESYSFWEAEARES